jgi:hypothetical protein
MLYKNQQAKRVVVTDRWERDRPLSGSSDGTVTSRTVYERDQRSQQR